MRGLPQGLTYHIQVDIDVDNVHLYARIPRPPPHSRISVVLSADCSEMCVSDESGDAP